MKLDLVTCVFALAAGFASAQSEPPEGWTCSTQRWNDNICHCGKCGIYDPDCDGDFRVSACLGSNEFCRPDTNECWDARVPLNWTCRPSEYNDNFACDCECGVPDPDCAKRVSSIECHSTGVFTTDYFKVCSANNTCIDAERKNDDDLAGVLTGLAVGGALLGVCCLGGVAFLVYMSIRSSRKPFTPIQNPSPGQVGPVTTNAYMPQPAAPQQTSQQGVMGMLPQQLQQGAMAMGIMPQQQGQQGVMQNYKGQKPIPPIKLSFQN